MNQLKAFITVSIFLLKISNFLLKMGIVQLKKNHQIILLYMQTNLYTIIMPNNILVQWAI